MNEEWIAEWSNRDALSSENIAEIAAWMRERPPSVQATMRHFPPGCLVVGTRHLVCPGKGEVGIVASYLEDGGMTVQNGPDGSIRAGCQADWLEVTGFRAGLDHAWVTSIIG